MEATASTTVQKQENRRICFSFAAYAKYVIDHLRNCKIPVVDGLTESEFSAIETAFGFDFPPDLRSILAEGLPVGTGFPNWRTSSPQQLEIFINLPISGLFNEISNRNFWCESWGQQPLNPNEALTVAKQLLAQAPILVPICRHCYIPSRPNLAGNPVFYINGRDFRYSGFDVAGFFQSEEFRPTQSIFRPVRSTSLEKKFTMLTPAWAAKSAKRIEFWSDLAEGRTCRVNNDTRQSFNSGTCESESGTCRQKWLKSCFDEVSCRLREGGWKEEEVRDMLLCEEELEKRVVLRDKESVVWHVRLLSLALLKAGWSTEDVVYSLGFGFQAQDEAARVLIKN